MGQLYDHLKDQLKKFSPSDWGLDFSFYSEEIHRSVFLGMINKIISCKGNC